MLRWVFALLLLGGSAQAATLEVISGTGNTTSPGTHDFINGVRDGGGAFSNRNVLCDASNPDTCAPVSATTGLTVNISTSSALPTNLTQINGSGIGLGQNTMANSMPVAIASNQGALSVTGNMGLAPQVSGGLLMSSTIAANNTTSIVIVTGAHQLFDVDGFSIHATVPVYAKFYNATSQTCGTGTPVWRVLVPASGATAGSGVVLHEANGLAFSTGIVMCITAGIADNDTTAPAASSYIVNVAYK